MKLILTLLLAPLLAFGQQLLDAQSVKPWSTMAQPARGVVFRDQWGLEMLRVTDHAKDGITGFTRNDYARRQAFNATGRKQLIYSYNGTWHTYWALNGKHIKTLAGPAGDAEPQWDPVLANTLYYLPTSGVGMKLMKLDVATNVSTQVADFGPRLKARWPTANSAWTKDEGSSSADGRYWCFMVDSVDWNGLGVFTWDKSTDTILGMHDITERPDHVSMSPSGNWCVTSSYGGPGVVAWSRDFAVNKKLAAVGEHSDIALLPNGHDAYTSVDYQTGELYFVDIDTAVRTTLFPIYVPSGYATALHVSGKAFKHPGWVIVSTYAESRSSGVYVQQWMARKIIAVELKANPRILAIADTHDWYRDYWSEPQASVSRDFSRVAWTARWKDTDEPLNVEAYQARIPAGALP